MTIKEMHIEVNLSMQSIASNVKRKFYPEEIDWILNKNIDRFVKSKIQPEKIQTKQGTQLAGGFQIDEINLDSLRTILELDYPLPIFKYSPEDSAVRAQLPNNYLHLVEDSSVVVRDCEPVFKAVNFAENSEFIYSLKIDKTAKTSAPFYANTSVKLEPTNGSPAINIIPANIFPQSLEDPSMIFTIQSVIKNYVNTQKPTKKLYWERYKSFYNPGCLLMVEASNIGPLKFATDSTVITAQIWNLTSYITEPVKGVIKSNRLVRSATKSNLQDSAFNKSSWLSPISNIQNNILKIYHDSKFIVTQAVISYIRKPQVVSLSLGIGCDLPEDYHQSICDMTVEYMKQTISDPNYQYKVQDNQLRGN